MTEQGKLKFEDYAHSIAGIDRRLKKTIKEFKDERVISLCGDLNFEFGMLLLLE